MSEIVSYRDLIAWQRAFALGVELYRLTAGFPDHERFGLTNQLRRGAVSVSSNIAEGYGRGSTADYIRFLKVARASLYEIDTQLLFAKEFRYLKDDDYANVKDRLDETDKVLAGLIRSLERR
ncbi:MAG: four helix bundle protein [Planctomycetes bacterium]|nr:four helix bundle protein [Planctomycetota bacterium]